MVTGNPEKHINQPGHPKSLWDMLMRAAAEFPSRGIGYVKEKGEIQFLTYGRLYELAQNLLSGLYQTGLQKGDKVILALNNNEETIPVLWACFAGGIIPTIMQPPVSFSSSNPALEKIINVYKKLEKPAIILSDDLALKWEDQVIPSGKIIKLSNIQEQSGNPLIPCFDTDEMAFIQFSSGSTGDPKGIILTHKNILINIAAISIGLDFNLSDRTVNWMPLYHDMGLIGYHIAPLFGEYNQFHIDSADFIKRPFIWLDIIDQVRGTITGCPNFGQALILRHLKKANSGTWDLSSIKAITNGAEPISVKIMTEFIERLEVNKLKQEAMMPVYGMAESTLAITFPPLLKAPLVLPFDRDELQKNLRGVRAKYNSPSAFWLPCVGRALNNISFRIVDEDDNELEESHLGHIQIKGPSVTSGYYNDHEATQEAFCGDWLRTGDQGFVYEGNLYITGRYKDIIFISGKNYYAHDLEQIACQVEGVVYGKVIVGGVFDEKKGHDIILLFLAGSVNQGTVNKMLDIRNLLREMLGITIDIFIPVSSNQIPKTSSGKIQRYKLVSSYLQGEFEEVIENTRGIIKSILQ